jgi:DHA1 family tetracycline resistance protein-like MFS transporter
MESSSPSQEIIRPMSASNPRKIFSLSLIFIIMLMDIVGLLILSPVAPFIVRQYSNQALAVTLVTMIYAGGQFIAAPFMGKLGDRYGRRPVLLISLIGQGLGYLIFGLGGGLWILYLGRLIGGITGGNFSTATAYLADISAPQERAKNFTLIGIAWSLGLILGPAMGALFGKISLSMPAYVAAILSLINVVLGIFFLPESLPRDHRSTIPIRFNDINPIGSISFMARKPGLGKLLIVTSLFNFAFNGIGSISSLFLIDKFGVDTSQVGWLMMLSGIGLAIVQFILVQRVVRRFGERSVAIGGLSTLALGELALIHIPFLWLIFPMNMLNSMISAFIFPTLTSLNTSRVEHREVGLLMGVTTSLASMMNIIAPLWAGVVFDRLIPGAPYWMGGIIMGIAAILLWKSK